MKVFFFFYYYSASFFDGERGALRADHTRTSVHRLPRPLLRRLMLFFFSAVVVVVACCYSGAVRVVALSATHTRRNSSSPSDADVETGYSNEARTAVWCTSASICNRPLHARSSSFYFKVALTHGIGTLQVRGNPARCGQGQGGKPAQRTRGYRYRSKGGRKVHHTPCAYLLVLCDIKLLLKLVGVFQLAVRCGVLLRLRRERSRRSVGADAQRGGKS